MTSDSRLHVAIDGCIGVGKTTLATKLAKFRNAHLLLEDFEKNPFLADFYSNPSAYVLETEIQFLLLHYHQLKGVAGGIAPETISDFTFFKDFIFAEINFRDAAEKSMFFQLYNFLLPRQPKPDVVIYLKASDDLIIERIRQRNRSVEQIIDVNYFKELNKAYELYFSRFNGPIHVIDADNFDCLNNPSVLADVSTAINRVANR